MFSVPFWASWINFLAAAAAIGVAGWLWMVRRENPLFLSAAGMLMATAVVSIASGLMCSSTTRTALWVRVLMGGELLQITALWAIPVTLRALPIDRWRWAGVWLVVSLLGLSMWSTLTIQADPFAAEAIILELGSLGRVLYAVVLIAMAVGLAQVEMIMRGTQDPVRFQIKYPLIGLGCIAAFQIYFASQILLLPVWESDLFLVGGVMHGLAIGLVVLGIVRGGSLDAAARIYISPRALIGSVTFIAIGLYLLAIGTLAEWFHRTGREIGPTTSLLTVLIGLIVLVLLASSRATRVAVRDTVTRHFYHSKYDYRLKWLEVTEAFEWANSVDAILDRVRDWLAHTFSTGKISIWLRVEADGRFHQVRSVNTEAPPAPLRADSLLLSLLGASPDPVTLEKPLHEGPDGGEQYLYVPVQQGERGLIAFFAMGRGLTGEEYGLDDRDLLRAVAAHVSLLLTRAQMAEEQASAAELHAFNRFASFCLHDLKNLAGKLSLVVQNAQVHGESPQFQQAAMKTVASTTQQMMALIGKLSPRSTAVETPELVDVHLLIRDIADQLSGPNRVPILLELTDVLPVVIVRAAFQQVLHNLIQNGQQAGGAANHVTVSTGMRQQHVQILIQDRGEGLSPDRLRTLFRPFTTTKKEGTGIGLYQCKVTVEAAGGTIIVESRVGEGTVVCVELPAAARVEAGILRAGGETAERMVY